MSEEIAVEYVPKEYQAVKTLLQSLLPENLPALQLNRNAGNRRHPRSVLKLHFSEQLRQRCGEALKSKVSLLLLSFNRQNLTCTD